ncbi:related to vegetatible incompatibility protein HET-E-1 [Phialocephala subalpina]|uniref:Related to vegetatible incompatibility protein HET-E-1 n=1 Tax=Phialocephala subalpina TaxID=576137 RepID=A0A1L7X654_9HELO|nr:related to vegetatible incompatibility protein HET-E-1 [Phialocephala subalpina]
MTAALPLRGLGLATPAGSRWTKALESLSENDRLQLQSNFPPDQAHYRGMLEEVLDIAVEKKQLCIKKAWKFKKSDGKVVIVRDLFEKIVVWVQKFKEVGDVAVSYDPGHAALPWAAVRFLLTIAIADTQTFGAMVEGIEKVAMLVTRCRILEQLYLNHGGDDIEFEEALVNLYVAILKFECNAIRFYGKNTAKRILSGVIATSSSVEEDFKKIAEAQIEVDSCAKFIDAKHQRETGQKVDALGVAIRGTYAKLDTTIMAIGQNQTRLETILRELEEPIVRSASMLQDYTDSMKEREREELLQWLSTIQHKKHHKVKRNEYLEGSCGWLLGSREYIKWKKSSTSSILWLHGIAGSGKSVLVSSVVEDFHQEQSGNPSAAPIAYFYCSRDAGESERANPEEIMRSILEQVASNTANLPIREPVVGIYKQKKRENRGLPPKEPLTLDETTDILLKIFEENPVTIVIDALDECDPDERHKLLEALDTIISESASLVRVFVSSRNDGDIVCQLEESPNIFIRASDNSADIARYVQEQVSEAIKKKRMIKGKVSPEMKERIVTTLIDGAQGMFRWVSLQIQQLCDNRRVKHEEDISLELGRLPKTLAESYEMIYQGILHMARASQSLAVRTFQLLLCAQRRLTPAEMLAAVTVDPLSGDPIISSEADLLDACCNMVFLDDEVGSFRFAHLSVREYLEARIDYATNIINVPVMNRCILIFLCESGDIVPNPSKEHVVVQQNEAFHRYATTYWPVHCGLGTMEVEKSTNLKRFIGTKGASSDAFEKWIISCNALKKIKGFRRRPRGNDVERMDSTELEPWHLKDRLLISVTTPPSILFVSCAFGLGPIIRHLLPREEIDWLQKYNTSFICPLVLAVQHGHLDIVEMLLQRQPGFYDEGAEGETSGSKALASAVANDEFAIAKLFLESRINRNVHDDSSQFRLETPLNIACERGLDSMVQLLLSHGADPNIGRFKFDEQYTWPEVLYSSLYDACNSRYYEIAEMLVKAGADIRNTSSSGNMLHHAAERGNETLVEILMDAEDVHIWSRDKEEKTPLHFAAESGNVAIIDMLVQKGYDINAKDSKDKKAIYYAATNDHAAAVDALIKHGADPHEKVASGDSLFRSAVYRGAATVVQLLIADTLDIEEKNIAGRTLLHVAATKGFEDIVRLLIARGADIHRVDENQSTALHLVAGIGNWFTHEAKIRIMQQLLERGAPINARDCKGNTPLAIAAKSCHDRRVELLVARGADTEIRNHEGHTPLQLAQDSRYHDREVTMELLLAKRLEVSTILQGVLLGESRFWTEPAEDSDCATVGR